MSEAQGLKESIWRDRHAGRVLEYPAIRAMMSRVPSCTQGNWNFTWCRNGEWVFMGGGVGAGDKPPTSFAKAWRHIPEPASNVEQLQCRWGRVQCR